MGDSTLRNESTLPSAPSAPANIAARVASVAAESTAASTATATTTSITPSKATFMFSCGVALVVVIFLGFGLGVLWFQRRHIWRLFSQCRRRPSALSTWRTAASQTQAMLRRTGRVAADAVDTVDAAGQRRKSLLPTCVQNGPWNRSWQENEHENHDQAQIPIHHPKSATAVVQSSDYRIKNLPPPPPAHMPSWTAVPPPLRILRVKRKPIQPKREAPEPRLVPLPEPFQDRWPARPAAAPSSISPWQPPPQAQPHPQPPSPAARHRSLWRNHRPQCGGDSQAAMAIPPPWSTSPVELPASPIKPWPRPAGAAATAAAAARRTAGMFVAPPSPPSDHYRGNSRRGDTMDSGLFAFSPSEVQIHEAKLWPAQGTIVVFRRI